MAPIPKTMKGVLVEATGGVEVLQHRTDLPVPTPKGDEVLVKNDFVGINFIDTYFRTGLYPSSKPEILGREAEGHIVAFGPSYSGPLKEGQRVVWMGTGAYAEFSAIEARNVFAISESVKAGVAAAAILQGLTAITLIDEAHAVKAGDWVLVHAAAGGVGQLLCQMLAARGAHTIATASTEEKRATAKRLGAEIVLGYDREELLETVKKATGGAGVIAIFDGVGKDTFETDLEAVARLGSIVSFGNASGTVPPLLINRLSAKNIRVVRPSLFNYLVTDEERARHCGALFDLLEANKLDVGIHNVYPLTDIKQSHLDLEGRKTSGKLLLDPTK